MQCMAPGGKKTESVISNEEKLSLFEKFKGSMKVGDDFNVVVVYEATPALFSDTEVSGAWYEDGVGYWYADWAESNIIG